MITKDIISLNITKLISSLFFSSIFFFTTKYLWKIKFIFREWLVGRSEPDQNEARILSNNYGAIGREENCTPTQSRELFFSCFYAKKINPRES